MWVPPTGAEYEPFAGDDYPDPKDWWLPIFNLVPGYRSNSTLFI